MNNTAISINNLSKRYTVSSSGNPMIHMDGNIAKKDFWALRDVNIKINEGDIIGLIGANGSGKSTLLKIIGGVTKPSMGQISIKGTVASILEVGAGFSPDLTGRQNIFMNGILLGMSKPSIKEKLEDIIDYSGIKDFIDIQVKHYSSGMYMRLAFSIIANLKTDIILLDEVMSVGDAEFRLKCTATIKNIVHEGRTVLLATHNPGEILSLCNKCIWLSEGKIVDVSEPNLIIERYYLNVYGINYASENKEEERIEAQEGAKEIEESMGLVEHISSTGNLETNLYDQMIVWSNPSIAPHSSIVRFKSIKAYGESKDYTQPIYIEDIILIEVEYEKLIADSDFHILIHISNASGLNIISDGLLLRYEETNTPYGQGTFKTIIKIPAFLLNTTVYFVNFSVVNKMNAHEFLRLLSFRLTHNPSKLSTAHSNMVQRITNQLVSGVRPNLVWETIAI